MPTVRAARAADLDTLTRHSMGVAAESEGLELDTEVVRRALGKVLADKHVGRYFVAEDNGRLVGSAFITYEWSDWYDAWYWWLQSAYVEPDRRSTGVFKAILRGMADAAKAEGDVRALRLYVETHNEAGLRAYRGLGMEELPYKVFEQRVDA